MKKILLVMAALFCVATVSAQQKWSIGAHVGTGLKADAEWFYSGDKYVEGRFGMGWGYHGSGICADFVALHNWNLCNWNWTPSVGKWYLDAGCGVNLGGRANYVFLGVAGTVKFGIKFNKVPIRLAIDYTPVVGPDIVYVKGASWAGFYGAGLYNCGLSATWCF